MTQLLEIDILLWTENNVPKDIIGIYTKDEEGTRILRRVLDNTKRMHPERHLEVQTYCTNIPNR